MNLQEDYLAHYGTKGHSGRYPHGSGENPHQHCGCFLARINELKKNGLSETEIAKSMGISTTKLRAQISLANAEVRAEKVAQAQALKAKGYSLKQIAKEMGFKNDSSVRSLLNESAEARMNAARKTADILKKAIDEKGMIDVGTGVENQLGVSK